MAARRFRPAVQPIRYGDASEGGGLALDNGRVPARRRLIVVALLAGALFATWMAFMPHSPHGLRELVARAGIVAPLAFVAVWALATPSMVSGTILAAAGGLLFGPVVGSAVSITGATLGGAVAFTIARRLGGGSLAGLGARAERMTQTIERNGFRAVLCLRAAPGVPATFVNYCAGLTRIRARDFVLASALGGAPRLCAYTVLGSNAAEASVFTVVAPIVVLVAMAVVGVAAARAFLNPRVGTSST
jgi:uncharacterized membrane protein YdjX (TVP38/TMEM64 family)